MQNTDLTGTYLRDLDAEATATRKCLERIPESLYDFKPHPKSMTLGYLTLLVAEIPTWLSAMIDQGEIDFATYQHFELSTQEKLSAHFEENLAKAKESLKSATEERLSGSFSLKRNGELLYTANVMEEIGSAIRHWVHHRGQLTVYMRLNDIAVPSIYGPSADDRTF
jgi:uncharacterized damage-inducible protein DinB